MTLLYADFNDDGGSQQLEAGVTSALEKSEVLMKTLGAVGDIHPAIGGGTLPSDLIIHPRF